VVELECIPELVRIEHEFRGSVLAACSFQLSEMTLPERSQAAEGR
jgi:hypothetical protein